MRQLQDDFGKLGTETRALNCHFATLYFDRDGAILRANTTLLRMFGYELEEIVGQTESYFLPDTEQMPEIDALWRALRAGQIGVLEGRRVDKVGREFWVRARYTPMVAGDGTLAEVIAIIEDISQDKLTLSDIGGQIAAINDSQAVVQFSLSGDILAANDIFLDAVGYGQDEIVGRHHRMLLRPEDADSEAYRGFWSDLAAGYHRSGEFVRVAKDGRHIVLQATYTPILDPAGKLCKIVKYATDITAERFRQAEYEWQLAAVQKSQAMIVFDLHGVILSANQRFLEAVGYTLDEIVGHHHRMFVGRAYAHGSEYAAFWRALKRGESQAGLFRRMARDGSDIWLQATYNPVFDLNGAPIKIVKYATIVTEEKLEQADYQGQIAAIHKANCVVTFALDGTILDANDNFLELMRCRYVDVRGYHHSMFIDPAERDSEAYRTFWERLAQGNHHSGEFRRMSRDGREVWLQAIYNPIFDMDGRLLRIVKYAIDITGERTERADIRGQIEAINRAQAAITLSLGGQILDVNANFLRIFGYASDELVGQFYTMLMEPDFAESVEYGAMWSKLCAGGFVSGLQKRRGKDGHVIWLQTTYNPIFDANDRVTKIVAFASDVTSSIALAEAYEKASRQAHQDTATTLPNRTSFMEFVGAALAEPGSRLAVFYLDIDHFKQINDTFGHSVGDRVLGEMAARLSGLIDEGQMVARIGGDEFVLALPEASDQEIEALCRSILREAGRPVHHEHGELRLSVSIGAAVSPHDATAPDELIGCADAALYRSKQEGRDTYSFFSAEMSDHMSITRRVVEEIRRGLAAGEFYLDYQPRFETTSGKIRGIEALIRWHHPERGRLNPDAFVPIAEQSGLIVPLGTWVLRTACASAAEVPDCNVSVNISPVQFKNGGFPDLIAEILAETGLPPARLELELTEGPLLADPTRAREMLDRLKEIGVGLVLDDFGTGCSSLSFLRNFPFDIIKIDRKFIAELDQEGANAEAIVKAILALGAAFGLSVTAEGVETDSQLFTLRQDHCAEAQGFLLARPMSMQAFKILAAETGILPNTPRP